MRVTWDDVFLIAIGIAAGGAAVALDVPTLLVVLAPVWGFVAWLGFVILGQDRRP